jgi:hypothetical protein
MRTIAVEGLTSQSNRSDLGRTTILRLPDSARFNFLHIVALNRLNITAKRDAKIRAQKLTPEQGKEIVRKAVMTE